MTDDNAKNKLTLSGKSTLTLKGVSDAGKSHGRDGKKIVQVEVRKKRVINMAPKPQEPKIDDETAAKLRLLAEAKEFDNRRRKEEEEKAVLRQKQKEQEEEERHRKEEEARLRLEMEEKKKQEQAKANQNVAKPVQEQENRSNLKAKEKKSRDFDDDDEDDDFENRKSKKTSGKEDGFEQDRKKITKRSFEPQRRK